VIITVILEDQDYKQLNAVFNDGMGIKMSREQMDAFLGRHPKLKINMAQHGIMDTCTRDSIMDDLSQELVKRWMPNNGEIRENPSLKEEYFRKLHSEALKAGYTIVANKNTR
jgi:hypothetical protein